LQETRLKNSVCQEQSSKQKSNKKKSVVYTSNITTTEIKEFKEERIAQTVYTGSLLTQELHPVS